MRATVQPYGVPLGLARNAPLRAPHRLSLLGVVTRLQLGRRHVPGARHTARFGGDRALMTLSAPTIGERFAAQSVIEELLRQQDATPEQSAFARLFGVSPLGADSISWYLGALGELEVGRVLGTLPPEWHVFHALPIDTRGTDIDHLVVGPGGIVTINTKNHRGKTIWVAGTTFMVSGHKVPYIRNAAYEADRVTKLFQERMPGLPPVHAAIALISPKTLTIKKRPAGVTIVTSRVFGAGW